MDNIEHGRVIRVHMHEDGIGYYAFVRPDGATSEQENIFVSSKVVKGEHLRRGDKVEFVPNAVRDKIHPCHSAARAWRASKEGSQDVT